MATAQATAPFCALCQTAIAPGEATTSCPGCAAPYHADCWQEVGGCGVYGCANVPPTEKRSDLEIPAAHWGKESKACPACGKDIQAMAVRCRHCGSTFATADPLSRRDFMKAKGRDGSRPGLKRRAAWLFAACALPFTTALAGPIGLWWYLRRRDEIERLPRLFPTLVWIGLGLSACQIGIVVLVLFLKTLFGR
jgi:hypothetical protein